MTDGDMILHWALAFALVALPVSFLITVIRVIIGPTLADRIVALDMLVAIAIGFIAVIALKTGYNLYIDIAIALGLVGFLATVAFARFVLASAGKVKAGTPKDSVKPKGKTNRKTVSGRKAK